MGKKSAMSFNEPKDKLNEISWCWLPWNYNSEWCRYRRRIKNQGELPYGESTIDSMMSEATSNILIQQLKENVYCNGAGQNWITHPACQKYGADCIDWQSSPAVAGVMYPAEDSNGNLLDFLVCFPNVLSVGPPPGGDGPLKMPMNVNHTHTPSYKPTKYKPMTRPLRERISKMLKQALSKSAQNMLNEEKPILRAASGGPSSCECYWQNSPNTTVACGGGSGCIACCNWGGDGPQSIIPSNPKGFKGDLGKQTLKGVKENKQRLNESATCNPPGMSGGEGNNCGADGDCSGTLQSSWLGPWCFCQNSFGGVIQNGSDAGCPQGNYTPPTTGGGPLEMPMNVNHTYTPSYKPTKYKPNMNPLKKSAINMLEELEDDEFLLNEFFACECGLYGGSGTAICLNTSGGCSTCCNNQMASENPRSTGGRRTFRNAYER